jgi:hypothetical protein
MIIGKDYRLNLLEASSGLQSAVPLFLVSRNLALSFQRKPDNSKVNISLRQGLRKTKEIEQVEKDTGLTKDEKTEKIRVIEAKYRNYCFINIVEELEQNLFPTSQKNLLESLLEFNNLHTENKLIMTTHSPYLISYLTMAVKAYEVKYKSNYSQSLNGRLNKVISEKALVGPEDWAIYEMDETTGTIMQLRNYKGLPEDNHYLNNLLVKINEEFGELRYIEKNNA